MKIDVIAEPELEFGGGGMHIDIRFGLRDFGPLDRTDVDAPHEISLGFVGTNETIEAAQAWLAKCQRGLPAKASPRSHLFPPFPGFGDSSPLPPIVTSDRMSRSISSKVLNKLASSPRSEELIRDAVAVFLNESRHLTDSANPDVVLCLPPANLMETLDPPAEMAIPLDRKSVPASVEAAEDQVVVPPPAFHDILKANGMSLPVPLQMVRAETYDPTKPRHKRRKVNQYAPLQDEATRAWNLFTALYYKAGGTPWRLRRSTKDLATCFVGISFYKSAEGDRLMTSMAQVFNELGDGIVVRGGPATVDKDDRQAHLTADASADLLKQALAAYRAEHRQMPARLAVHKTSTFNRAELEGFASAAKEASIDWSDLVSLRKSRTRFFRYEPLPPLRGAFASLDANVHLLYARGTVDFFETYPGLYVPRALEIRTDSVESTPLALATEILALSKMDWNNTQFDRGEPVTTRVARQVGNILRQVPEGGTVRPRYSYFM